MTFKPYFKPVSLHFDARPWGLIVAVLGVLASLSVCYSAAPNILVLLPWLIVLHSWQRLNGQHRRLFHHRNDGSLHVQITQQAPQNSSESILAQVLKTFIVGRLLYTAYQLPNRAKQSVWLLLSSDEEHAIRCWCRMQRDLPPHSNHL